MRMQDMKLTNEIPAVDEFIELRVLAGLSRNEREAAERGLPGSRYSVCVRAADRLIGMGRVIGDGGLFYQVVDIAVHPDYQRQGIGFRIMRGLMQQLRDNAPRSAYVSLVADGDAAVLYRKFGFENTAPASHGMALRL